MEVSEGEMIWEKKCGEVDAPNKFDHYLHSVMTKCSLRDCLQRKSGNLKERNICHLPFRILMRNTNACAVEQTYMAQGCRGTIRYGGGCMVEETKWTGKEGHLVDHRT